MQIVDNKCPTCNAKLFTNESDLSAKCVFCRNNVIVNKTKDKYPMPDKIIPFKIDKNAAKRIIRKEFSKKKLLPNDINDYLKEIKGVYIPFWLYANKYEVVLRKFNIAELEGNFYTTSKERSIPEILDDITSYYELKNLKNIIVIFLASLLSTFVVVRLIENKYKIKKTTEANSYIDEENIIIK